MPRKRTTRRKGARNRAKAAPIARRLRAPRRYVCGGVCFAGAQSPRPASVSRMRGRKARHAPRLYVHQFRCAARSKRAASDAATCSRLKVCDFKTAHGKPQHTNPLAHYRLRSSLTLLECAPFGREKRREWMLFVRGSAVCACGLGGLSRRRACASAARRARVPCGGGSRRRFFACGGGCCAVPALVGSRRRLFGLARRVRGSARGAKKAPRLGALRRLSRLA